MNERRQTDDRLLGGRVVFRQPATGYRAAIDPVLLASAVAEDCNGTIVDLGCGTGAAALCAAARVPGCKLIGIERDPAMAELARENAAANGFAERLRIVAGDIESAPIEAGAAAEVIANPPYLDAARADAVTDPGKASATVESDAELADWVRIALRLVKHKGAITFVHRADRLDELLALLRLGAGEIVVVPLWPKRGVTAKRVIVRARKGIATPLRLTAGLVLHEADGAYTAAANHVLRDAGSLWRALELSAGA